MEVRRIHRKEGLRRIHRKEGYYCWDAAVERLPHLDGKRAGLTPR
jgi:hypothetical protein